MALGMKQRKAELFRRPKKNFYKDAKTHTLGKGPHGKYLLFLGFKSPGWIAFDFMTSVEHDTEQTVDKGEFELVIDNKLRFRARGSYTWERQYLFVDAGHHYFEFKTNKAYKDEDEAWVRYINGTEFELVESLAAIGDISPPKPKFTINRFNILNGRDRYQRSGMQGTEIKMKGIIKSPEDYNDFIEELNNFYVLRYSGGLYGGVFIPQDNAYRRLGRIYELDLEFESAQLPGERVLLL